MNTKELLEFHEAMSEKGRVIMHKKNHDYSGASGETPFKNFMVTEQLGIATTEQGILIRMLDKMMRLSTFCKDGQLKVENEGAEDALVDIMNYSILLAAYIREKVGYHINTPVKQPTVMDIMDDSF